MIRTRRVTLTIASVMALTAAMVFLSGLGPALLTVLAGSVGRPVGPEQSAAARRQRPQSPRGAAALAETRVGAWQQFIDANFAGDQACASCHPQQFAAQQRSGHSRTLTRFRDTALAQRLLRQPTYRDPHRGQTFQFESDGDEVLVRAISHPRQPAIPVTWLLGSGTHAQTPVAVDLAAQQGVELRWSYLAHRDALGVTPDHERFQTYDPATVECFGRPLDGAGLRACLGCHATISPPPQLPIENSLYVPNVGCERCHGPRKKHVQLAQQGLADEAPPLVTFDDVDSYLNLCSACHRDETNISPDAAPHELARFQPLGLKRSRCFTQTPGGMTCSTCHDPHDAVSHDRAQHIRNCQQCHQSQTRNACPENPAGDCIECHMPATPWTSGIRFHDHWIRRHAS